MLRIHFSKQKYFFLQKDRVVIRLTAESAFIPRRSYPIPARYSLRLCSVTRTRPSRWRWGGRACIGREDNGVPGRGIFDAVETITRLSGIVDHAPVFPEVRAARRRRQEGPYGAYLTSHSVRAMADHFKKPIDSTVGAHCPHARRVLHGPPTWSPARDHVIEKKATREKESRAEISIFRWEEKSDILN